MNELSVAPIDKMRWVVLYAMFVMLHAFFSDSALDFSAGFVASAFLQGFVIAAFFWIFQRHWMWYNWLNAGSYIGIFLLMLNVFGNPILKHFLGI